MSHNCPLTIEALIYPMFLLSLARFVSRFLYELPDLIRKTARRGKYWLSNWRYVRRGQPSVNFEIRAL